jgi:hypothetical protein
MATASGGAFDAVTPWQQLIKFSGGTCGGGVAPEMNSRWMGWTLRGEMEWSLVRVKVKGTGNAGGGWVCLANKIVF